LCAFFLPFETLVIFLYIVSVFLLAYKYQRNKSLLKENAEVQKHKLQKDCPADSENKQ